MNRYLARGLAIMVMISSAPHIVAADPARPNILFIMTDQQFGDAMSCRMGDDYIHTPAMDSLAAQGMVFSRAYVANPLCMPARNSIFTGMYPHQTGVTQNSSGNKNPNDFVCLGQIFRRAGYDTAYFGKWHLFFNRKQEAEHGFQTTANTKREKYWDTEISGSAIEYLSKSHRQPYCAVVSFHNPHDACELARGETLPGGPIGQIPPLPQCPPAPQNLAPPENETDSMVFLRRGYHASKMFPVGDFSIDRWRQHRWGYYRLIEKVDREIGLLLAALKRSGHAENTVVVFTSDHGECAGAHRFNQKTVFYDESSRVPLIVSWPGKTAPAVSDFLVNTGIDIIPTLCDFAGIAVADQLPGLSLRSIAEGSPAQPTREHVVIQNHMVQAGNLDGFKPEMHGRMVRTDRFKYCVYEYGTRRESLIDMKNDPQESKNLASDPEYQTVLADHRQRLSRYAIEQNDEMAKRLLQDNVAARPFPIPTR